MPDDSDLPSIWAHEDSAQIDITHKGEVIAGLDQPLLIYTDRRQAIKKLNKRMIFTVPLMALYCMLAASVHMFAAVAAIVITFVVMYLLVVRSFNRNTEPLLTIDSRGIKVHGLITRCFVTWENLEKFEPFTMIYRFVGIQPKSVWKMDAAPWTKLLLIVNSLSLMIYSFIGKKVYAINIPEQYSHFTAEEICEQIEARRQYYASSSAGVSAKHMQSSSAKALTVNADESSHVIKLKETAPENVPNQDN